MMHHCVYILFLHDLEGDDKMLIFLIDESKYGFLMKVIIYLIYIDSSI
jgi:hypothetical protein